LAKKHVFCSAGTVAGMGCKTLACGLEIMVLQYLCLTANGTAVEGGCVTGAASRILVLILSSETVPVASQYGAIFAITVSEGFITIAVQVVC
jgi:hypothetical protein